MREKEREKLQVWKPEDISRIQSSHLAILSFLSSHLIFESLRWRRRRICLRFLFSTFSAFCANWIKLKNFQWTLNSTHCCRFGIIEKANKYKWEEVDRFTICIPMSTDMCRRRRLTLQNRTTTTSMFAIFNLHFLACSLPQYWQLSIFDSFDHDFHECKGFVVVGLCVFDLNITNTNW